MNIFLDNIIFSLQKSGGISVVWYELLRRLIIDSEINPYFLEARNKNIFRKNLLIPEDRFLKNPYSGYPINIQRFLNPNSAIEKGIFHSSYYRTNSNPKCINITTVHDFTYEHFRSGLPLKMHHCQKAAAIRNSKRIICVSQNTKEDLLKFFPKINQKNVRVIYNGVDSIYQPLINKKETELNKLLDFSSGEFVLFVGDRNNRYKNFGNAVLACRISKVPLVFVGGGTLSQMEISILTRSLGQFGYKHLPGISNEQLNLLYNHALCLLYPSISEGFGIPIVEAQRAGCSVITTNYSSIPEVAGKGAILLDLVTENHITEAISHLKKDYRLVSYLTEEGIKNSQRFSWDLCYQQTKNLYKEIYEEYL